MLNFFWVSPLFSLANTFKIQEFLPKFEYFQQHSKLYTSFILIKLNKYIPHHTMKIKYFNFFWISPLFSWANTFKTQEFRPKIEYFQQHSKFYTSFILIKFNKYIPHHTMKIKDFSLFWISPLFSWANTFKIQEFRLKIEYFQQHSIFCT